MISHFSFFWKAAVCKFREMRCKHEWSPQPPQFKIWRQYRRCCALDTNKYREYPFSAADIIKLHQCGWMATFRSRNRCNEEAAHAAEPNQWFKDCRPNNKIDYLAHRNQQYAPWSKSTTSKTTIRREYLLIGVKICSQIASEFDEFLICASA